MSAKSKIESPFCKTQRVGQRGLPPERSTVAKGIYTKAREIDAIYRIERLDDRATDVLSLTFSTNERICSSSLAREASCSILRIIRLLEDAMMGFGALGCGPGPTKTGRRQTKRAREGPRRRTPLGQTTHSAVFDLPSPILRDRTTGTHLPGLMTHYLVHFRLWFQASFEEFRGQRTGKPPVSKQFSYYVEFFYLENICKWKMTVLLKILFGNRRFAPPYFWHSNLDYLPV